MSTNGCENGSWLNEDRPAWRITSIVILDELRKEAETFRLPILVVGVRDGFFVLLSVEGTDTTTGDCGELLPGESGGSFSAITTPSLLASKTNNKTEKNDHRPIQITEQCKISELHKQWLIYHSSKLFTRQKVSYWYIENLFCSMGPCEQPQPP